MKKTPERQALEEILSDGEWKDGQWVLRQIMRIVPPGEASRVAIRTREGYRKQPANEPSAEELVAMGRRKVAHTTLMAALKVRFEVDVELTREHWSGVEPWQVRDPQAGWMSVPEVANRLGLSENTVYGWISNGYVPEPVLNHAGRKRITPETFAIYERVRALYPGSGARRWSVDPRSVWHETESPEMKCPHCGQPLSITLNKKQ